MFRCINKTAKATEAANREVTKDGFDHFMLKEIFEQPDSISNTLEGRLSDDAVIVESFGNRAPELLAKVESVYIIACGTSYHAAMVAKYWIESMVGIPCQVEIASEYRYRKSVVVANSLFISISQSGETADTLAALRSSKEAGYLAALTVCNVPNSSLVRESDLCLMTQAGPEIGVASTKAFTTQLVALVVMAFLWRRLRQWLNLYRTDTLERLLSGPRLRRTQSRWMGRRNCDWESRRQP